jgi:hypothetical protein
VTDTAISEVPTCKNCQHPLTGNFCAHCGQEVKEIRRPIFFLLRDAFSSVFELDGRAFRTVFSLFTRPGFLSQEYLSGRRARYTPPLRLFLVISISFFLILSAYNSLQSMRDTIRNPAPTTGSDTAAAPAPILDEEGREELNQLLGLIDNFNLSFLSERRNENLRLYMHTQSEKNLAAIGEDPSGFFFDSLDYITVFMLLMMPILALIQKLLYLFSKRYYVEHLILTLHNHAFLVLSMFLSNLTTALGNLNENLLGPVMGVADRLLGLWMLVYLFLSLKNFFGQGYGITAAKFVTMAILYAIVTAAGMLSFAAVLFFLF